MADQDNSMAENKSTLKSFLASIASMAGSDLSNITAPPFVLATKSVIEIPAFWAENPSIFVSPATSENVAERALLMLRSFLAGCRSQCYMGHDVDAGVKKPLNAFLGELFLGKWEDDHGTTHMVSEQISHHPPISACRVWNDKYGVIAEGYNRQTITFNGSVNVQCTGHILKSIIKYDEHYLMPIPDFKIKGVLGTPYPELSDTYYIPCTSGYTSVVHFSGKSMFSTAKKHKFTAHLFKAEDGESNPLYTIEGHWDTEFTITDNTAGKDIEVFNVDVDALKDIPNLIIDPIDEQDPWESRNAWQDTVAAIKNNDMQGVTDAKGRIEQGQRDMREAEEQKGEVWKPLFFISSKDDSIVRRLSTQVPNEDYREQKSETAGAWEFNMEAWKTTTKPYHGSLRPDNTRSKVIASAQTVPKQQQRQQKTLTNRPKFKDTGHSADAVDRQRSVDLHGAPDHDDRRPEIRHSVRATGSQTVSQPTLEDHTSDHRSGNAPGGTISEKEQIENMLRDQTSTASDVRKASHAKRKSLNTQVK